MDPMFWGPGLWKAIHAMAATADSRKDRMHFKNMMTHMAHVLPCKVCRTHLTENMQRNPIEKYMKSNESLFLWTFLLHDAVNDAQGKRGDNRPSFYDVYNTFFKQNPSKNNEVDYSIQDGICQDVCAEEKVITKENVRSTTTSNNYQAKVYKPRFKSRK